MEKRWNILLAAAILGSLVFVSFLHANEAAEKAAIASSSAWLSPPSCPYRKSILFLIGA